jgi:uncharacterized phage protein gp47/JayE
MTTYGLTDDGFVPKTREVVRGEIEDALRAAFGNSIPLGDKTRFGHLVGVVTEQYGQLWDAGQGLFNAFDPDSATGAAQDNVCAYTGVQRQGPKPSTVVLTLCGAPTTIVNSGSQASTASTKRKFKTLANATIGALAAWTGTHGYFAGDRVTNASRCYQCITSGTSAGSGGPSSTASDITDNTVHWRYIGEGTGAIDANAESVDTGPVVALANDITVRETPVSGWQSVRNLLDAEEGTDLESHEVLRIRRELELVAEGSTQDQIRRAILDLPDVTTCSVFVNNTDSTDVDGMPPHSVEALVQGGADQDIIDALFASVPAGIQTTNSGGGAVTGTATDSEGIAHTIKFSRPVSVNVYVDLSYSYDVATYPTDGDTQVKTAVADLGGVGGVDAVASRVGAAAFQVDGVFDVTRVLIYTATIGTPAAWIFSHGYTAGDVVTNDGGRCYICITTGTSAGSGGPTGTGTDITDNTAHWRFLGATIPITKRQLAAFDTSRVAVHATAGTP